MYHKYAMSSMRVPCRKMLYDHLINISLRILLQNMYMLFSEYRKNIFCSLGRTLYHLKVKQLKRDSDQNRFSKMAEAISNNDSRNLWSELKRLGKASAQANCIDECTGNQSIAELFANKYKTVYNSVGFCANALEDLEKELETKISNSHSMDHYVTADEVGKAISKLNLNKRDGNLGLFSNHFKHASNSGGSRKNHKGGR